MSPRGDCRRSVVSLHAAVGVPVAERLAPERCSLLWREDCEPVSLTDLKVLPVCRRPAPWQPHEGEDANLSCADPGLMLC